MLACECTVICNNTGTVRPRSSSPCPFHQGAAMLDPSQLDHKAKTDVSLSFKFNTDESDTCTNTRRFPPAT